MLGLGWTEMLVVGIVALIVIGPKDLPDLMHKIGRFAGQMRKMGQDFQRELNKSTGLNEISNLRNTITAPLKATTDAIRKEFNTTTPSGAVEPSGAIKPADPKAESIVDELHAAAGMSKPATQPTMTTAEAIKQALAKQAANRPEMTVPAAAAAAVVPAAEAAAEPAKPRVKAAPRRKAAPKLDSPAPAEAVPAATDAKPEAVASTPKRPRTRRPVESPAPVEAIAPAKPPRQRAPRKAKIDGANTDGARSDGATPATDGAAPTSTGTN